MTIPQATEALRGSVGPDTLLCTDGSGAMRGAAKALGVTSKSIAVSYGGRVAEGVYHVQTVNSYHERAVLADARLARRRDEVPA